MIRNAANALIWMGYALDVDFVCSSAENGAVVLTWFSQQPQPTAAEIAAAELPAAKAERIEANRAECGSRIVERYPAWRQSNVALGVYAGPEAEARAAEMRDWLAAMVAAENTAADAIEAATTVAAVEAVTVAWPA